jgi:1-acyl-sn-glycerol-3-phosphate acyltransferase
MGLRSLIGCCSVKLRALRRAVALASVIIICICDYWRLRSRGPLSLERRAQWLHASARKLLSSLGIQTRIHGHPPSRGLIVSNHLSYLDILILAAATPCFFVSKVEISRWPIFGKAARVSGTIFLVRTSRASAESVAAEIEQRLALPVPVLLFPEGTSTDGSMVLRFHSRLIQPAVTAAAPVTAAAVRYVIQGGIQERELCWFGDTLFLSHLWKALNTAGFAAELRFGAPRVYLDRRVATREAHAEVVAMRVEGAPLPRQIAM